MILPGGIIGGALPSVTRTDTDAYAAGAVNPITFASQSLGTAGRRNIIIALAHYSTNAATGVTVAGITATQIVSEVVNASRRCSLWIASVPTGTTGDVVVTFAGAVARAYIGVYAAYNLASSAARDTATFSLIGTATPYFLDLSADVPARGIAVGVYAGDLVSATPAAVGLSNDVVLRNDGGAKANSADYTATAAETPRTMGWDTSNQGAGCLATFR